MRYFLVDGMCPQWPVFVRTIHEDPTLGELEFSNRQKETRKEIEMFWGQSGKALGPLKGVRVLGSGRHCGDHLSERRAA